MCEESNVGDKTIIKIKAEAAEALHESAFCYLIF
jgi:hypothetical protein